MRSPGRTSGIRSAGRPRDAADATSRARAEGGERAAKCRLPRLLYSHPDSWKGSVRRFSCPSMSVSSERIAAFSAPVEVIGTSVAGCLLPHICWHPSSRPIAGRASSSSGCARQASQARRLPPHAGAPFPWLCRSTGLEKRTDLKQSSARRPSSCAASITTRWLLRPHRISGQVMRRRPGPDGERLFAFPIATEKPVKIVADIYPRR